MVLPIRYNGNSIYIISVRLPTLKEFLKVIALYSCVAHVYVSLIIVVEMV